MMNQELVLIFTIKNSLVINCLVYFRTRKLSLKSNICKIFLQEFYFLLNLNDAVMPPVWEIRAANRSSSEPGFPKSQSNVCLYFGSIYNKYTQNYILCIWWIECPGFIGLLLHWIAIFISWTGAQLHDPACQHNFSWVCMWCLPSRATLWKGISSLPSSLPFKQWHVSSCMKKSHRYLRYVQPAVNSSSKE